MVFHFSVIDRLIFQNPDISNFCKSFVFLKAITDSDDIFRQEIEETFFKFSQNRFYSDFHYFYSGSKYTTTEENCIPPVVQLRRKTDLCAAVQLQYYGKPGNPELDEFLQGNCQIMINYDWHNPKGLIQ